MILVACAADSKKGYYWDLEKAVRNAGIEFLFHKFTTFSWAAMLEWEQEVADAHPSSIVCFVDAWDFLFQGTAQDIVAALGTSDVLFHSEATCWPEPHKADFYPPAPTRYRYVNGTGPCGYGWAISKLIEHGNAHYPIRGRESSMFADCDQRFWTDCFLGPNYVGRPSMRIDYDCALSVSLNAVPRSEFRIVERKLLLNSYMIPAFVHANGASKHKYADLLEELR